MSRHFSWMSPVEWPVNTLKPLVCSLAVILRAMAAVAGFRSCSPFLPPSEAVRRGRRLSSRVSAESRDGSSASSVTVENEGRVGPVITPPPNFKPPEPRRFAVRPDKILDVFTASLPLLLRLATGVFVQGYSASLVSEVPPGEYAFKIAGLMIKETSKLGPRPEKPIEIYEFESCPFCRKVREIVSFLDLDVLFYPCPRNGPNFRPKVAEMGGKQQFPYMVDPNTGTAMYESDNIIKYLVEKYGDGTTPLMLSLGLLTTLTAGLAMIGRIGRGSSYVPSKLPAKPLELWAYEPSPFCKIVREVLVELELPHVLHSCARGSPKRQNVYEKTGHFQVPYLEDPNTGVKMFESAAIIDYLKATYVLPPTL